MEGAKLKIDDAQGTALGFGSQDAPSWNLTRIGSPGADEAGSSVAHEAGCAHLVRGRRFREREVLSSRSRRTSGDEQALPSEMTKIPARFAVILENTRSVSS
jgi:hypothetical protein